MTDDNLEELIEHPTGTDPINWGTSQDDDPALVIPDHWQLADPDVDRHHALVGVALALLPTIPGIEAQSEDVMSGDDLAQGRGPSLRQYSLRIPEGNIRGRIPIEMLGFLPPDQLAAFTRIDATHVLRDLARDLVRMAAAINAEADRIGETP